MTQRDTYVIGEESYRTEVSLRNAGATLRAITLYRAGDCYLQDSDEGFGEVDPATGAVACKTPPDPVSGNARIEQWFPLSPGSRYFEASYDEVWARIGQQLEFDDTCRCDEHIDNGAGLSWAMTLAGDETATLAHLTTFSPAGRQPLTMSKTVDSPSAPADGENGYTITIRNPGDLAVDLTAVTDRLPIGFAYVAGSTTGATTADPSIAGDTLTWSDIAVPANGEVTFHFRVTVAATPGEYRNHADAVATGPAVVVGTGPTAPVTVTADGVEPAITLATPEDGSSGSDPTPTLAGVAGTASGDLAHVTVEIWSGATTDGEPIRALTATRDGATGEFSVDAAPALDDGTYTARARQSDAAGNSGRSAPRTFTVDTIPPVVTLDAPVTGSSTSDPTPAFGGVAGTAAGDEATVTLDVYAGPEAIGLPVQVLPTTRDAGTGVYAVDAAAPLSPGAYAARARQQDGAGNTGLSAATTFTVVAAGPRLRLESYAAGTTDGEWGLTEGLLSTTRGYVLIRRTSAPAGSWMPRSRSGWELTRRRRVRWPVWTSSSPDGSRPAPTTTTRRRCCATSCSRAAR